MNNHDIGNREIKFRAWDTVKNYMVNSTSYLKGFVVGTYFDNNDKELYDQTDKLVVMQYTGLKDKNEKEIYEGDVVRMITYDMNNEKQITNEVVKSEGYFGYYPLNRDDERDSYPFKIKFIYAEDVMNCEVIGNIFENKNLIL